MRKFKKIFKRISKKTIISLILIAMVVGYLLPMTNVFADGDFVVTFTASGDHEMTNDGGHLKVDGQYVEIRDSGDNNIGTVNCTDSKNCTITVTGGKTGTLNYNSAKKFTLYMQGHEFDMKHVFSANENIAVQDYEEHGGVEPGPEGPGFDGKAYLVWSCANGGTCYHYFDNIPDFDDGNSTFYKDTDIKDDNSDETFNIKATYIGWYLKADFDAWIENYKVAKNVEEINWKTVDPKLAVGDPLSSDSIAAYEKAAVEAEFCDKTKLKKDELEKCVNDYAATKGAIWTHKLQPLGEPDANNSYVSYGDRNFKVVIYNSDFKGVAMGSLNSLHYYPSQWTNPFIKRDQFDISGTSKDNPALMDSILLESTVVIKALDYNSFAISKIEALDVPEDAVNVIKDGNEFKLVFSSNFYDNVTFKVTDTNNKVSYVKIKRYTIDAWFKFVNNHPVLNADFFFDEERTYSDFDITAKIIYKDGTTKNVTLTASYGIDDGLGNITDAYEVKEEDFGGKGLKKAAFQYNLEDGEDREIKRIYLNAEYKGSTASNYAGAYVGSGEGVLANIFVGEDD